MIIPARNTKHLVLRREIVEAVDSGQFTVYAVNTVEEALALLTGMPTGERGPDGLYPEGTLYDRVGRRLEEMAAIVAAWGEGEEEGRPTNSK